jgi:hypothetical protein
MKDPRERYIVCKLNRYELEDRYLRLLEEVNSLKKLSNSQEDKIKRLATKLMRYGTNPRACIAAVDLTNDRDKLSHLEAENSKVGPPLHPSGRLYFSFLFFFPFFVFYTNFFPGK